MFLYYKIGSFFHQQGLVAIAGERKFLQSGGRQRGDVRYARYDES